MATQATIFRVDKAAWGRQPGPAYGVRVDTQYLPKQVWVVGFLSIGDDGEIQELLAPGYIRPETQASYDACVKYAREVLAGEWKWKSDEPYQGLVA